MNRLEALEKLLARIAEAAEMLAYFASYAAENDGPESTYCMYAVQAMSERIGASARFGLEEPVINAAYHLIGHDLARALAEAPMAGPLPQGKTPGGKS